jgi:hypothetical protein
MLLPGALTRTTLVPSPGLPIPPIVVTDVVGEAILIMVGVLVDLIGDENWGLAAETGIIWIEVGGNVG